MARIRSNHPDLLDYLECLIVVYRHKSHLSREDAKSFKIFCIALLCLAELKTVPWIYIQAKYMHKLSHRLLADAISKITKDYP